MHSSRIKELVQLCGLEINMIFSLDLIANSSCHLVALCLKDLKHTYYYSFSKLFFFTSYFIFPFNIPYKLVYLI